MKNSIATSIILASAITYLSGQPPLLWQQTYGGGNEDQGQSIWLTEDGNMVLAGYSKSYTWGMADAWLIKTDGSGNQIWENNYGGFERDYADYISGTSDSGFVLIGTINSVTEGYGKAWLIRTDAAGDTLWTKAFGVEAANTLCNGYSGATLEDGGFIIVGQTEYIDNLMSDLLLIKTDSMGNTVWIKNVNVSVYDLGRAIQETKDGGFIIAGDTHGAIGGFDIWLVKTNASGDTLWTKAFGGPDGDGGYAVIECSDGGYAITGSTWDTEYEEEVWLGKTDSLGILEWSRSLGGSGFQGGKSIQETVDGGFIIVGSARGEGEEDNLTDLLIIKTDSAGSEEWRIVSSGSGWDTGNAVVQTPDYEYLVLGSTTSMGAGNHDYWLLSFGFSSEPVIGQITDVPNDQGGQVLLTWSPSKYDVASQLTHYAIWLQDRFGSWVEVDTVHACVTEHEYERAVATFSDSTASGIGWSRFKIVAHTSDPEVYYTSLIDSGYSVDNIAPAQPAGLAAAYDSDTSGVVISWTRNVEPDLSHYILYQSTTSGFVPTASDSIARAEKSDSLYIQTGLVPGTTYYFRIAAVDSGGNMSDFSNEANVTVPRIQPHITNIADVPEDQGRWVHVRWRASILDYVDSLVTQYGVWEFHPDSGWVSVGSVPALQDSGYIYLAHTYGDSNQAGMYWSKFRVTAHTTLPEIYYTSAIDSGYSVDNIHPATPTDLVAEILEQSTIYLNWSDAVDEDFAYFRIYRSVVAGIEPQDEDPYAETIRSAFLDYPTLSPAILFYRISTVDANGNESELSEEVSATIHSNAESTEIPTEYMLHNNHPNPFNPSSNIRYDIPEGTQVRLIIFDIVGREIVRLIDSRVEPGYHQVVWNGCDRVGREVPTGIYIARLFTPHFTKSIKMVLLK